MFQKKATALFVSTLLLGASTITLANEQPALSPAKQAFVNRMVKKYHFKKADVTKILGEAKYLPWVVNAMNRPIEKKTWDYYRKFFITKKRIQLGEAYWNKHEDVLNKVSKKYGVPPQIIVAIIGVETFYGEHTGKYSVLNTLNTLAFHYSKRAPFFQKELAQFLVLARENKMNPMDVKGSYAGALGIPQFMPSSYHFYGVSYKNNAPADLFKNDADAIASVGNYLASVGWKAGKPVTIPATLTKSKAKKVATDSPRLRYTAAQFKKMGIQMPIKFSAKQKMSLYPLVKDNGSKQYWIALPNFRAIMNYNGSVNYAMAVYQLSKELKKAHGQKET